MSHHLHVRIPSPLSNGELTPRIQVNPRQTTVVIQALQDEVTTLRRRLDVLERGKKRYKEFSEVLLIVLKRHGVDWRVG
jgi:hypothetical protein